jgi:HlyD family secretion protein
MKLSKTLTVMTVMLVAVSVLTLAGCAAKSHSTAKPQTAVVQRGSIAVSTTSTGNLAFSQTADLSFDMAGTVEEVMVAQGDTVTKGQQVAKLDTTQWDKQVKTLQKALTTAQRSLASAQRQVTTNELAVRQAELNLQTSQNSLKQILVVKTAQDTIDSLTNAIDIAQLSYAANPMFWGPQIESFRAQLAEARNNLRDVLSGSSAQVSSDMALQIAKAQLQVEQSSMQLESARIAVGDATQSVTDATQAVADAQIDLDETQNLSPVVLAEFAGYITNVNVKGGDQIQKGTVAMRIADPTKFEVDVLVGQRDISGMAVGGMATVGVDAMTGVTLPARITTVAPTATVQQGVVNYSVTVEILSFMPVSGQPTLGSSSPSLPSFGSGDGSTGLPPFGSGGGIPGVPPTGTGNFVPPGVTPPVQAGQTPATGSQSALTRPVVLRQGMSVTANLVTAQKSNVLTIPNRAIVRQQGKTYVKLEKNGTTEQVPVTTGIANSQYTEVTDGVAEGDVVVLPVVTNTTATSGQQGGGQGFPGGGIGGILR